MCESRVVLVCGAVTEPVMEDAVRVEQIDGEVVCVGVSGERKAVPGARIVRADLAGHTVELAMDQTPARKY